MRKIHARLKLNLLLKSPIRSGYRPLFFFTDKNPTSGSIKLLDCDHLFPGKEALVDITFVSDDLVKDMIVGLKIKVGESPRDIIGECEILNVGADDLLPKNSTDLK